MNRLVVASNRVSLPRRGAPPGGLAVGLLAAMRSCGGLWFGWSGEIEEVVDEQAQQAQRDGISYATVDLTSADNEDYYLGFCNDVLWPVFHYFLDGLEYLDRQYEAYHRVNQRFARTLAPLLQPNDLVWVHDYHLIPLAAKLRELGAGQRMGFFLHIPFPAPEVLRAVPVYGDLLQGLLAYDVVGFQTQTDLAAFRAAVALVWGPQSVAAADTVVVGERTVRAAVFPIGVDVAGIQAEATGALGSEATRRMVAALFDRRLLVGVDRLDYSKGLVERFRAYERFLETYPDNQNRVTFMQIAPLSRADVLAYATIRDQLERAAGRTNGRFADTDWTPIRYLNRDFPHDVLMSFLRIARVGIVTPLRDGMNLVAKEFIAAQDENDPGVLVLSSMAGAAQELSAALQVNPYDARGIAHALQMAIAMPLQERRDRHLANLEVLRRNDLTAWQERFVAALGG